MKNFITASLALTLFLGFELFAKNDTPDFYLCSGRVGGEWNFGRGPYGCDASSFGEDRYLLNTYPNIIFQDKANNRDTERLRYMDELHAVIRDAAEYYIKKRKPNVSSEEINAWKLALLTTATQESYWSHYRAPSSDTKIKMMRGDVGHGHGMMQVDDRWHYPAVKNGTAWNLIGNLTYSMDEFYAAWEKAPNASCVRGPTNYEARIRSSWAAYNGGIANLCRWTNPNSKWAMNDTGFAQKLRGKSWQALVKNPSRLASINVSCLIEKKENCPPPTDRTDPPPPALKENILYRTEVGKPCVFKAGTLQCMPEYRDSLCLRAVSSYTNINPVLAGNDIIKNIPVKFLDRHSTCRAYDPSLIRVGRMAEIKQDILLRSTPGGGQVGFVARGEVVEVLDFEIRNFNSNDRYYKVNLNGIEGFFYGGDKSDNKLWAITSAFTSPLPPVIARPDESIVIVNPAGINLRETSGGTFITNIPVGTKLVVMDYAIQGKDGDVYYQVTYRRKIGFIYSGMLLPKDTTKLWTARIK